MIVIIIGYLALTLFTLQFCFSSYSYTNYDTIRGYVLVDNTLLLICAAICFK